VNLRVLCFLVCLVFVSASTLASHASGPILFEDDFETGLRPEWTIGSPGCDSPHGSWTIEAGQLCAKVETYEECTSAVVGNPSWVDYAISFDVVLREGLDRIVGIHYQDFTHQLQLNLNTWLGKVVMVAGRDLVVFEAPYTLELGVSYHVRFGIFGDEAGVQIDGKNVGGLDVSALFASGLIPTSGGIALESYVGGVAAANDICFDNVVIEGLHSVKADKASWGTLKMRY